MAVVGLERVAIVAIIAPLKQAIFLVAAMVERPNQLPAVAVVLALK